MTPINSIGEEAGPVAPRVRAAAELRARRRRITDVLLGALTIVGGLAYIPSVWAAVSVGAWSIVVLDTVVYAAVVVAFLHRGLPAAVRAGTVVAVAAVLGLTLSVVFGPNSAGALYLCAAPVLTALLFGRRATVWSMVVVAAAFGTIAALRWADAVAWDVTPGGVLLWLVIAGNAILIAAALALAVSALIGGLTEAAARTEAYATALATEQEALLHSNDRLQRAISDRARAESKLRQAEKLSAMGTLASGIAHDLNNLLVPILGSAELLRAEEQDDHSQRAELLDRTLDAANAGRDLVQRLLAFSRPGAERRRALPAARAFSDATRLLRAVLPSSVAPVFQADPDVGAVLLSAAEVHQILLNLGTNAANAMPGGGSLTITVDAVQATGSEPPNVPRPGSGRFVRITVTDTGVGMDEDTLARMYDPFFSGWTQATDTAGHGIGMATVHGIVTSAGGFLSARSTPGEGTAIEVFLPRIDAAAEPAPASARVDRRGKGERVLIVDDDEGVRRFVTRLLERAGYSAEAVGDAAEALRRARDAHAFDLVITDQGLPDMAGLDLAVALRETAPAPPVVLLSGFVDTELERRAAGVVERVLAKPFGARELTDAIDSVLHGDHAAGPRDAASRSR